MNPEEFNIGSSMRGPFIGFWFSFVTMTTVGLVSLFLRDFLVRSGYMGHISYVFWKLLCCFNQCHQGKMEISHVKTLAAVNIFDAN